MSNASCAADAKTPCSDLAIWSCVLGVVGLFCLGPFAWLPGLICGHVALNRIARSRGALGGRGLALTGVCVSYAALIVNVAVVAVVVLVTGDGQRALAGLRQRLNYAFTVACDGPAGAQGQAANEAVAAVLDARLAAAGIKHKILPVAAGNSVEVRVALVGDASAEHVRGLLTCGGNLELRLVYERNAERVAELFDKGLAPAGYRRARFAGRDGYEADATVRGAARPAAEAGPLANFHVPDESYMFMLNRERVDGRELLQPVFVARRAALSGVHVKEARVDVDATGRPSVSLVFDAEGAKRFFTLTGDYAPGGRLNPDPNGSRQLAVVVDDVLLSAPIIREPIAGGRAEISGNFTLAEARSLSAALGAGRLPAPVRVVGERGL